MTRLLPFVSSFEKECTAQYRLRAENLKKAGRNICSRHTLWFAGSRQIETHPRRPRPTARNSSLCRAIHRNRRERPELSIRCRAACFQKDLPLATRCDTASGRSSTASTTLNISGVRTDAERESCYRDSRRIQDFSGAAEKRNRTSCHNTSRNPRLFIR